MKSPLASAMGDMFRPPHCRGNTESEARKAAPGFLLHSDVEPTLPTSRVTLACSCPVVLAWGFPDILAAASCSFPLLSGSGFMAAWQLSQSPCPILLFTVIPLINILHIYSYVLGSASQADPDAHPALVTDTFTVGLLTLPPKLVPSPPLTSFLCSTRPVYGIILSPYQPQFITS